MRRGRDGIIDLRMSAGIGSASPVAVARRLNLARAVTNHYGCDLWTEDQDRTALCIPLHERGKPEELADRLLSEADVTVTVLNGLPDCGHERGILMNLGNPNKILGARDCLAVLSKALKPQTVQTYWDLSDKNIGIQGLMELSVLAGIAEAVNNYK